MRGAPQAGGDARHGEGDEVVEVAIGGGRQLQRAEADVVQSLIVDAESVICVLDQLMYREGGIVGLHHSVRNLGTGNNAEGVHDPVGELFPNLGVFFEHTCKKSINLQRQISSCQKIHPQKIVTNYKKSPKNWKPCFCEEKSSSVHTKPQTRPGKLGKNSTFYHNLPQILQNFLRF